MSELRTPPKKQPVRSAEAQAIRQALQTITAQPEWAVLIEYFRNRLYRETVSRSSPDVSALLMIEGRRSFHRELSDLPKRVNDERSDLSDDG